MGVRRDVRLAALAVSGEILNGATGVLERRDLPHDGFCVEPEALAAAFPGRWNARRALPDPSVGDLVRACARALRGAGWWNRGEEAQPAILALGSDTHYLSNLVRFTEEVARSPSAGLSPSRFLFSLPSSVTSLLGILFALREYQTTITEGGASGVRAVEHATDLITTGRAERALVAAFSASSARDSRESLAVALCLEAVDGIPAPTTARLRLPGGCCILSTPIGLTEAGLAHNETMHTSAAGLLLGALAAGSHFIGRT